MPARPLSRNLAALSLVFALGTVLGAPTVAVAKFDGHRRSTADDGVIAHRARYAGSKCTERQLPYYDVKGHWIWRLTRVCRPISD